VLRSLTGEGKTLVQRGHRIAAEVDARMLDGMSEGNVVTLCELLRRIRDNLTG
jgi:DNA-binding MarR family transcriptional regulator